MDGVNNYARDGQIVDLLKMSIISNILDEGSDAEDPVNENLSVAGNFVCQGMGK